ncbi:hypothetical protein AUJ66_02485 [Candidatus Desantisbacteria bacterium CG1_02_38_46]|uniref:AB hydrolase-1 domain-containing protein n=3 Tax=unclassified Candidatus Desantisiibacteriota TaxID=3106372 RepID=A0A2H9PBS4_9BACT|nr:MAG: hypothetical protein AUJ66_02485 [Candidatus Desantisbacteria bacterium CG1_02_38_46]PIU51114.1 MAG: hypothetical protein COS91_06165 [Candidatus Desantisbacteria bacterium CG07_land_8_20_14_0_80_39_15]PIZ16394.1 MAG: hypothetical protein COY51_02905 [Candidatus Desantisbacteria bacterium CG_4_10_14_0_8_um_filter_39_17]
MGWLVNNYIVRGIANFFLGTGLIISQVAGDPELSAYKNLDFNKFTISSEDGVTIVGTHIRSGRDCPAVANRSGPPRRTVTQTFRSAVIIIVHGICCFRKYPQILALAKDISSKYDVITIDMRGHGESSGEWTGGTKERTDIRIAIDYAKWLGYEKIGLIGFSAGGIASIGEEARSPALDAMVLVSMLSSPDKVKSGGGGLLCTNSVAIQAIGKVLVLPMGARLGLPIKVASPLSVVDKINCPVLFIHGKNDWVIESKQSQILYNLANEPKKILILNSAEHAEALYWDKTKEFYSAVMDWFGKELDD